MENSKNAIKLSIITINYNNCDGLKKTAKSIIKQTIRDFEWVVIDGGSTDGSTDFIQRNAEHITYWQSELDNGIYNAMNKGIQKSHGDYLLFMNSGDCLYDESVLENVSPLLRGQDIYVGDIVNDMGDKQILYKFPRELTSETILYQMVFNYIPHQSSFIRRDLFERYGLYREDLKIASDGYFFYKSVVLGGATMECIPITIALFDYTGISSVNNKRSMEERSSAHDITPCEKILYCFYRDNYDVIQAFYSNIIGRFILRLYFFIYRKLKR